MGLAQSKKAWAAASLLAALVASGGMTIGPPDHPVRMSGLRVAGLAGYEVLDRSGERVGRIIKVEADSLGRTRWLRIALDEGGEAKVASFRADLDQINKLISLRLAEDILLARSEAEEVSSPSA